MTRLFIHIDRLVLKGIDRADASSVRSAIESELALRLADPQAADEVSATGHRRRIRADDVAAGRVHGPHGLGRAIARSIARGVRR